MPVTWVETRDIPLARLSRFPGNARQGNVDEIRTSIRTFGQYRALVVRDMGDRLVILAGNHTSMALEAEGHETARCEVITCNDQEAKKINLADNRLAEMGSYDDDALADLLFALDGDYEGTGWVAEDLSRLLGDEEDEGGDAPVDDLSAAYGIIVECDTEQQQAQLLAQLDGEGWRVRAMM